MQVQTVLLLGVVLMEGLSLPVENKADKDAVKERVLKVLDYLKDDQANDEIVSIEGLERRKRLLKKHFMEENSQHSKRDHDNLDEDNVKEKSRSHSDMIEEEDVDPNNMKLMVLLEGMAVEKNGTVYKVKGLHHELTAMANASKLETIPEKMDDKKRNFGKLSKKWPKSIIPYVIDKQSIVREKSYNIIKKAADLLNARTCLKWLPHTPELAKQVGHNHYVEFKTGRGCFSKFGYAYWKNPQIITMQEPNCMSVDIAVHEMLHAAGLVHEQSRSDRDKYIRLIKENLGGNIYNSNFDKDDTLDQNPYDYESIMQYGLRTFSINGKNTIEFLDKDLEFLAGTAAGEGISFYDIKDVIVNYQCAAHCKDPPACINGGFINHDCVCYCPRGYTGKTCETVITDNDCGGMVDVPPGDDVFVISPGYPAPYALGKICRWGVTAPEGWRLQITVEELRLPANMAYRRCYHWLEIQYNLPGQTGIKRCGDMNGDQWTGSKISPNVMTITFDSKFVQNRPARKGFRLRFNTIPLNDTLPCQSNPCLNGGTCNENGKLFTCTCLATYTGTLCETEVNCKRSTIGWEYDSTTAITVSNRTCQHWKDSSPHSHGFTALLGDQENFCRNPDQEPNGPWCYTTDPAKRWEYCNIPKCVTDPNECLSTARGADYFGHVNTTISGRTCMRWDSQSPHSHDYGYAKDQENYCRNHYGISAGGPWCYTTDPNKRWENCNIPCLMYRIN